MAYNFSGLQKNYNFEGLDKSGYDFGGLKKTPVPVPVEKPEGIYEGFIKPTAKEIGGGFKEVGARLAKGIDPLETISQTGKGLTLGMLGFADMVYSRIMSAGQQLAMNGKIDPEVMRIAGEAREKLYEFEVTDPGAKTITEMIGVVPTGVKTFFQNFLGELVDKEKHPNVWAGLMTLGDIGELAAFGEVFKLLKVREDPKIDPQKLEPLDATFAKNEVKKRIAQERAATKQKPLETLARKEETLRAKPTEPTAREIKQAELEETFKDYDFEGLEKAETPKVEPKSEPIEAPTEPKKVEGAKLQEVVEPVTPTVEKPIGTFNKKRKNTLGEWVKEDIPVLSVSEPINIKGKVTGSNWRVDYETPSTLGKTGKQTNSEYFWRKDQAQKWIDDIQKPSPEKPAKGKEPIKVTGGKEKTVSVDMPKAKAEDLTPKQQKAYLIEEIDKALKTAIDDSSLELERLPKQTKYDPIPLASEVTGKTKRNMEKAGTVTIHVPGDGDFTILNTKRALEAFKKAAKQFPVSEPKRSAPSVVSTTPRGTRISGIEGEYYNDFTPRKQGIIEQPPIEKGKPPRQFYVDGYFTDSNYIIKTGKKPDKLKHPIGVSPEAPSLEPVLKDAKKAKPAVLAGETLTSPDKDSGLNPTVHGVTKDGTGHFLYNTAYVDSILTLYPKATPFINKEKTGLLVFKDKGGIVGAVMPMVTGRKPGSFEEMPEIVQRKYAEKYGEPKPRTVKDIAKDLNTALGKRGSIEVGKLTPEQEAAIIRLKGDIENIKSEAQRLGKTVEKYLLDKKYDPQTAYLLHRYADDLPKYARSINLQKQDIPEDYKAFEATLLSSKPKKTQTWEQSEKLAEKYTKDVKTQSDLFAKAKKGTLPLTTEKLLAMRQINVNAIEGLKRIAEMDDIELARQALDSYRDNIGHVLSDASSEVGRMLNIHKKEVAINNLGKALTELEKDLTPRQFEELKDLNLEDPVMVQNFIKQLKDPKTSDYFLEYWYNAILSGPPTHVVNAVSNTLWTSFQVPHRVITAAVDKVYSGITGKQRQFYLNEVVPMLAGYKSGFKKGKAVASEVLRTGKARKFEDKWYQELDFSMGAWRRSPNETLRNLAPYVDVPTRALRAMDVWANAIAYDGEIYSIVRRMANEKGLKGKERAKFEAEMRKNVTPEMHEAARAKALNSTFMDEPDPFTKYVISSRNVPVIGPVLRVAVIPFVNTISNLTKRGIELTPGLGIAKEAISRGMGRGMPTQKLIAKQIMGSVIAFYVVNKAAEGRITGPMPESKQEREAWYRMNKKPWSIKIGGTYNKETNEIDGGTWYQYRRIEPFNTVVAGAYLAYKEMKAAMDKGDEKTATEHFGHFADQMKNNLIDGSYLSGLQQVFDKYGGRKGAVARWGASWVPYSSFWRSINRSVEVLREGEAKPREGNEWLTAFSQVIPGLSGEMPAKLEVWGTESVIPGGVFQQWLPFKWSKETNDPVEKELARLEFYPMLPKQTVSWKGKDVKLPDDVYRSYCIEYGSELKSAFAVRITREGWEQRPPESRKDILEKVRRKSGLKARRNLVRNYLSKIRSN